VTGLFESTHINGLNLHNRFVRSTTPDGMCTKKLFEDDTSIDETNFFQMLTIYSIMYWIMVNPIRFPEKWKKTGELSPSP